MRSSLGNWAPQHVPKGMGYVGPSKDMGSTHHQPSGAPTPHPRPHRLVLYSTLAQLGPLGPSGELFCFSFGSQQPLLPTYHTRPPGAAVDRMAGEKAALSVSVSICCISKPQARELPPGRAQSSTLLLQLSCWSDGLLFFPSLQEPPLSSPPVCGPASSEHCEAQVSGVSTWVALEGRKWD